MPKNHIREVGDHFIVGLRPSATLHPLDRALLADLNPAGVILYKSNFLHDQPYAIWLEAYARLIDDIRSVIGRERWFLGIDHEGGRVCRTPAPMTRFAYAAQWVKQAGAVGHAMGRELASLAVNLSFAPVLDIHSNPGNPVIGARSFGATPESVSSAALAFMSALRAEGVLACGKHFPGHGDTDKDSHYELPVLNQDLEALKERELKPFVAAIEAGIPMIMTSHILLPKVDPGVPVTMSRPFVHELLRGELGFEGVVVSDDIGMQAVSRLFDDPEATVRLFGAGTDLMMVCSHWTDTERCRQFAKTLLEARRKRQVNAEWDDLSRERIRALLEVTPQHRVASLPPEIFAAHRDAGALFQAETVEVI